MRQALPPFSDADHISPHFAALYTTDLITEFRPGTSPPPVKIPKSYSQSLLHCSFAGIKRELRLTHRMVAQNFFIR